MATYAVIGLKNYFSKFNGSDVLLGRNILPGEPLQLIVKKKSSFSILTCIFTILLLQLSTVVTPSGLPGRDVAQVVERGFTHAFETAQTRSQMGEGKTVMALDQQRKQSNVTFQNAKYVSYFVFAGVFRSFVGGTLVLSINYGSNAWNILTLCDNYLFNYQLNLFMPGICPVLQAIKCLQTSVSVKSCCVKMRQSYNKLVSSCLQR